MYEQYGLSDPFFLMLYGGAAMLALTECCYMLVALRSTLAPHVVPPRGLRYWTAAFFAAVAASHLWWATLGIVWLRDDRLTRDIVAIMLDYITLVPLVMAVLLRLLQDRKRQLWPGTPEDLSVRIPPRLEIRGLSPSEGLLLLASGARRLLSR